MYSKMSFHERDIRRWEAVYLANYAAKKGRLKKQPCEICGEAKVEMHHEDYDRPFYIRFLCKLHHRLVTKKWLHLLPARPEDETREHMLSLQYAASKGRGPKILQGLPQRGRTQETGRSEAILGAS